MTALDVKLAFDAIGFAAQVLDAVDYAEAAQSLERQLDNAYFLDPTLAMRVNADKTWDSKMRLLRAAAAFQAVVRAERVLLGVETE